MPILFISAVAIGILVYVRFFALQTYQYTTAKGQQYSLKYFPNGKIRSGNDMAEKLDWPEFRDGPSMLVADLKDDLGITLSITDAVDKPITKTCTGTDQFAFNVGDYEVCKLVSENKTAGLMAKVGNDGKYFGVVIGTAYDGKRITKDKDTEYAKKFHTFDILQHEDTLKIILQSIRPIN